MKTSALTISLILLLVSLAGCLGNNESRIGSRIGCPDNPPEGTTCVPNRNDFGIGNDALELVYAKETNLSGFDLRDADFSGAVFSYADLSGADLSGADLSGSIIRGANFINATITGTNFQGAIYDENTFWYPGWNDKDGDGILDEGRVPDHIKEKMVYLGPETNL
ncbi:MAG: pentapeptide repeat-containing protein, partial [Candidatus Thalassarchaeaceae archaeon]